MKECTMCRQFKDFSEYHKAKGGKFGLHGRCKQCSSEKYKEYYYANREKCLAKTRRHRLKDGSKERHAELVLRSYYENKEPVLQRAKQYYYDNKDRILVRNAMVRQQRRVERLASIDPKVEEIRRINQRIRNRLRHRISTAIRKGYKSGSAVNDLGCSVEEFRSYIEERFQEGMSWDNWGKTTWHLDHIKPLSHFDLRNREEFVEAVHYTNIQPLWARDNLRKNDRWTSH